MRILIVTQTVDENDPLLGFFVRWIVEFAAQCDHVHVLALNVGPYSLPENVTVHCLGKSEGKTKFVWWWRLVSLSYSLRAQYDAVFVHMNPEYVHAGGLLWRMLRKKIGLWYTHGSVNIRLRVATLLSHVVFTASSESFGVHTLKKRVVGHGIDTDYFAPRDTEKLFDLITVGRITRSKNIEAQLSSLAALKALGFTPTLTIVGNVSTETDRDYEVALREQAKKLDVTEQISWYGSVPHKQLPDLLSKAKVFIHTAQNGSLDKVVLEALSCGIPVVSTAPGVASIPFSHCHVAPEQFTETLIDVLQTDSRVMQGDELRAYAIETHSIHTLISRLIKIYEI